MCYEECPYFKRKFKGTTHCEKADEEVTYNKACVYRESDRELKTVHSNKRKRNKRERYIAYQNRLKRLAGITRYPSCIIFKEEKWIGGQGYVTLSKPYYKKFSRRKCSKYLKKQSHRKIRRYKGDLSNGWFCHKLFDYWWELA